MAETAVTDDQLSSALRAADKAGNADDARKLAKALQDRRTKVVGTGSADPSRIASDVDFEFRGADPSIDYDSGADSALPKFWLARSDKPEEARLALEHFYGQGNVGQDSRGRWWVKEKNGKKVAVYGGMLSETAYGMAAYSPILGGAIAGAGGGGTAFPEFTPASEIIGAGVGAVGGDAVQQLVKALQGVYAKTPREQIEKSSDEALFNMAFESLPSASRAVLNPIKKGLRSFFGITPEGEAMTRAISGPSAAKSFRPKSDTTGAAGVPPLKTSVPGMVGLHWHQEFRNKIMGDPKASQNVAYVRAQLRNVLEDSGYDPKQINDMMDEFTRKDAALGSLDEGKMITEKIGAHREALAKEATAAVSTARVAVEDEIKSLRGLGTQDAGQLGKDVVSALSAERKAFGRAMNRAYEQVHELTGGVAIVRTEEIKAEASRILDLLPETAHPPLLKKIVNLPETITLKDAHSYRSQLREAAWSGNLTPGLTARNLNEAADTFDAAITESGEHMETLGLGNVAKTLKEVDKAYGEGIAKFRDAQFNQWIRRARTGIFPDADTVAGQLIRKGEGDRLTTFWSMAPPELRTRISRADMSNILKESDGTAIAFYDALNKRGAMLDTVYGKADADKLRTAARELAALDGKLPPDIPVDSPRVEAALKQQTQKLEELDRFVSENPIAALGVPAAADRAVRAVTMPGKENVTLQARNFFGENSPEWRKIQTYALKNLFSRVIVQTPDLSASVVGSAMRKELGRYTQPQLDMLFPGGLEEDLRVLGEKADFLFPEKGSDMSAGLAAGAVKAGLPFTAPAWLYAKMWGWVADHPVWFHNLASTARSGNMSEFRAMRRLIYRLAISSAARSGPGSEQAPQQQQ